MTKFSGTLPKGQANGLDALTHKLLNNPKGTHIIVGVIDVKTVTTDVDTGDQVATVRFRRVEAIHEQDADHALRMLARGVERRTGATMLPIEVEDELQSLIDSLDLDLETGELRDAAGDVTAVNPDVTPDQTADVEGDNEPAVPAETPEPVPAETPEPAAEPDTKEPGQDAPAQETPAETPAEEKPAPKKRGRPRKTQEPKAEPTPKPADTMPDFTVPDDLSGWDEPQKEAS